MDVIAHGLWGGALFYGHGRKRFLAAGLLGMAPDLLSFGIFHVTHPGWLIERLAGNISGPPALTLLPPYLFHAYNVTHSLIIWTVTFFLLWQCLRKPPWLLIAWMLHILCDIPTHRATYFPTPFLWPFPTPFVDGVAWSAPWFMAMNYAAIFTVYGCLFFYFRQKGS
ncbi:MAG: hypothetical protein ACREQO_19555 [Candidatus Binatia bacterium]